MSSVKNISVLTASLALLVTGICAARATSVIKTTLRGRLLKSDGRPLANTEIELVPLESAKLVIDGRLNGISSASGRFLFVDVPPGEYTLSINFDDKPTELSPYDTFFYPNTYDRSAASVFRIDSSTILKDVEFRLPQALQKKSIVGRVIWEDGRPIEDALIGFWDLKSDKGTGFGSSHTDRNGAFQVVGFEGRKYRIGAIVFDRVPKTPLEPPGNLIGGGESNEFVVSEGMGAVTIKVQRSPEYQRLLDRYVGMLFSPPTHLSF